MSRIQVVKSNASSYASYYGHGRRNELATEKETTVIEKASTDTSDVLDELKESRKLNETMRNELQQVIRFNVVLQQEIDALQQSHKEHERVLVRTIVPSDNGVSLGYFSLQQGRTYIIESHITCINVDVVDGCGIVLALYEKGQSRVLGSGAAAWNNRANEDDNPYAGMQTVIIRAVFTPTESREYALEIREIGSKHAQILFNHPSFPCITSVL